MNMIKHAVLGGLTAVLVLSAVPAPAAELPDGVEAVIKQAQEEGASAREARRVARYAYKNGGESEALQSMDNFRKMLKEGVEDREAGKAVMKTVRARVRAGETGGGKEARVRTEAGDGEGSGGQVRNGSGEGDGTGEQVRTRAREGKGGPDAVSDKDAEKQVKKQLSEKKQQRLRERKKVQQREEEGKMGERRNRFQHRGEAGSCTDGSGKQGNR